MRRGFIAFFFGVTDVGPVVALIAAFVDAAFIIAVPKFVSAIEIAILGKCVTATFFPGTVLMKNCLGLEGFCVEPLIVETFVPRF